MTDTTSPAVGTDSRVIAVVESYPEAEEIVQTLAEGDFPIEKTRIVGEDLKIVQHVTGRLSLGGAILRGAWAGAVAGLLIGWLFGMANFWIPVIAGLLVTFYGLIAGGVVGAAVGWVYYALTRQNRFLLTVSALQPGRYEVLAESDVANQAFSILARKGAH